MTSESELRAHFGLSAKEALRFLASLLPKPVVTISFDPPTDADRVARNLPRLRATVTYVSERGDPARLVVP